MWFLSLQGTAADGEINRIFSGKMKSYVKCIDIDFESARTEDFYGTCGFIDFKNRD